MKGFPKSVEVYSRCVPVVFRDLPDGEMGQTGYVPLEICIARSCPASEHWPTLVHETGHVLLHLSGLSYLFTDDQAEAFCECMGNGIGRSIRFLR